MVIIVSQGVSIFKSIDIEIASKSLSAVETRIHSFSFWYKVVETSLYTYIFFCQSFNTKIWDQKGDWESLNLVQKVLNKAKIFDRHSRKSRLCLKILDPDQNNQQELTKNCLVLTKINTRWRFLTEINEKNKFIISWPIIIKTKPQQLRNNRRIQKERNRQLRQNLSLDRYHLSRPERLDFLS
jgi:hypothetical protein